VPCEHDDTVVPPDDDAVPDALPELDAVPEVPVAVPDVPDAVPPEDAVAPEDVPEDVPELEVEEPLSLELLDEQAASSDAIPAANDKAAATLMTDSLCSEETKRGYVPPQRPTTVSPDEVAMVKNR
jgi:hypothetical protein